MKKWGVKQHWLTPHSKKWGVNWPPWPRASAVYGLRSEFSKFLETVTTNLLSFEDVDESKLFLETIHQFILLSLECLVCWQQLLHLLLLVVHIILLTTSDIVSFTNISESCHYQCCYHRMLWCSWFHKNRGFRQFSKPGFPRSWVLQVGRHKKQGKKIIGLLTEN